MSQPQPPLDEQGEAREALNSAVTNYGPRILQNPQILGNVVTDLLPDLPREQNLLVAAAEADVATDLSQHIRNQNLEPGTAVQLAAHALAGKKSIDPAASMWVTTEYAKALGYDVPVYVPPPTPSPEAVPVPPPSSHSVPLAQSVPAPDAQAVPHSVPLAQSIPPPDAQAVPQSDPLAPQSAPPWSVPSWQSAPQAPPLAGQQPVPPAGGYGGGAQAGPWSYGPAAPGGPPGPPDNSKKNRGILIAIISAAAVIVIVIVVAAAGAHVFGGSTPAPSPTNTPQARPASTTSSPTPTSSGPSNQQVADAIANLAVGNGPLGPLTSADGITATQATCDPRTVSNPPDPSTPSTASCDIDYSDGTVWRQTVTVNFDSNGDPVSDSTNGGIQIG